MQLHALHKVVVALSFAQGDSPQHTQLYLMSSLCIFQSCSYNSDEFTYACDHEKLLHCMEYDMYSNTNFASTSIGCAQVVWSII